MREIKFRAWDTLLRQMMTNVEGAVIMARRSEFEVMQYTGLKDKNGKEIYEGDIIAIGLAHKIVKAVIEWNDKEACFGCKWDADTAGVRKEVGMPNLPANLVSSGSPWGVIGNIYENKELLDA